MRPRRLRPPRARCQGAACASAGRTISTSKARSPWRCRARTRTSPSIPRRSTRARCSTWWRMRWACRATRHRRDPPHGRRLRRQGDAGQPVRGHRGHRGQEAPPRGQDPPRPRRRHDRHRQAARFRHRLRGRLRRRRQRSLASTYVYAARCGYSSDLSGPVTDRALFHCDNAYFWPAVHGQVGAALHQHRLQHRLPRLRRAAGHGRRRARHRRGRLRGRQGPAGDPQAQFLRPDGRGRRAQRHALSPDGRGQHHPPHRRRTGGESRLRPPAARDFRLQQQQPHHQARAGADAGEVRHLLHQDAVQPGRRAGPCLHRRLGAPEPWRHRDGAGALYQGRAGGGRGVPDRPSTR